MAQDKREDTDEECLWAEPGQAGVTPGQILTCCSIPATALPALQQGGHGQGKAGPNLGDSPLLDRHSWLHLRQLHANEEKYQLLFNELHQTKRKSRKLKSNLQVSWSRRLLLFRRCGCPGRFQVR